MKHNYSPLSLVVSFRRLSLIILSLSTLIAWGQPGKNGPLTVNALNTVVNCYSAVTANVSSGSTTIVTDNSCTLECGDLVMVYQAQGASINTPNTDQYGNITGYNNSGLYEFNYVVSASGGTVTVQTPWANSYTASGKVQLIKVPQYTTLTVNASGSIVPSAWQDSGGFRKGGIVAIHATGTITVNGVIQSNGAGFRAGVIEQNTTTAGGPIVLDYVSTNASLGGEKGESIAGFGPEYDGLSGRYGRGAPANGGGGGNGHNAGGGGGSNGNNGNAYNGQGIMCTACAGSTAWNLDPFVIGNGGVLTTSSGGGRGGYTYGSSNQDALTLAPDANSWGGDRRRPIGGYGGRPLTITPASRLFFGGGGGAGDSNNSGNQAGGPGGGMVYIIAPTIAGTGSISANGSDALNQIANSSGCANDAPGGGGGGGSIILKSTVANTLVINAKGGKGGDQGFLSSESEGPGGGGGGGYVAISSGAPTITVTGGANGITLSGSLTEFTPNGATSGAAGQNQTVPAAFIIYVPVDLTATVNTPICAGNAINFTTTVNYPGGTYAWTGPASFTSTAQNPSIASATIANSGNYRVIYTSPGGCKDTAYVDVLVNPNPVVTNTVTNPLCNGDCNGSAAISFTTPGTAPYTYAWSNAQTAQTASGLCAGTYTATVTDANGCTATTSATIVTPPALTATAVIVNTSCNAACNGTITVTATGGTGTKQYSLNGGTYQASNAFTGLCAGAYVITVKDANNCTFTLNSTITQPAVLALTLVSTTPATCGNNNGTITVSATGGTTAYSYSIGGAGQAGSTFSALAAGTYTVTVTDANGCTQTISATVTAANSPIASVLSQQNVTCFGGVNGSVLIGTSGGAAPYTYKLNAGAPQASNSFSPLSVGAYTVTVTDVNGCTSLVSFTITSPAQLTYTFVMTPASCNGVCDGQIQVTTAGGTGPFSFSHNNGTTFSSANPITGLCAGSVNLVVQDANGCLANSVVNVTQPAPLSATVVPTNPTCHDVCNGQAVITATGGTASYQYSANGGPLQASPTLTGLCAGNQPLLIQDSHGCQFTTSTTLVNPPGITLTLNSMVESNCGFNNGSLDVSASGLHPAFQYSMNGGAFQSTGVYTNLLAGAYDIVVMDAIGCLDSTFFGVNDIEMDGILLTMTDVTCFGGSDGTVQVTNVSGAPPITYELDNSGSTQTNGTFNGLPQGSHIVTIYDGGLCVFTIPFMTAQPTEVAFNTAITNNVCNGGSTGAIAFTGTSGGTGAYTYSIDNGTTFQPAATFGGLPAGTYDLAVMDANSCVVNGTAVITEATPVVYTSSVFDLTCNANNTGFIQLDASGGNGGYVYSIDNGATFSAVSAFPGLSAGTYNIVVNDQQSCTVSGTLAVAEPPVLTATYATTPELCNGSCNGTITVTAAGGTGTYQYSTDNGVTYGVSGLLASLCAGNYTVIVRDQQSCQTTSSQTIASPAGVSFTTTTTPSTCGQANGTLQFTAAGGTGTYQYSINNGATFVATNAFTGLLAGTYALVVQDGNNCPVDTTKTITDQPAPVITGVFATEPLCNASCDGQISVTTTGGIGALQFTIGGPAQADSLFTAICAGNYTVTITDANGCTDNAPIAVSQPAPLTFTSTGTNLTCYENSTGAVEITAAGGTVPYLYSYDNGATFTASSATNFIAAGTYNLVVTDDHNCQATGQQIVTEPTLLTANVAVVDATCSSYCDGTATATAAGGTMGAGYTYTWSAGVTTSAGNNASALCANSYSVDVTDQNGCLASTNFTINEPVPFTVDSVTWTEPSCNTFCDGSITIYAPTGVTFSFDGGTTSGATNTLANVCAGNYTIQVTNAAGCIASSGAIVDQPLPLQVFSTPDSVMCAADTIPLFAIAVGGTDPYTYSWDNGVNNQTQDVHPAVPTTYTVFATDAHGCVSPTAVTNFTMLQVLSFNVTADTSICAGSSLLLSASSVNGYPDYSYLWSTGPNDTLTSVTVNPTAPATYTISVTDRCMTVDSVINVGFYAVPQMTVTADNANGCSPLTVTFTPDISTALLGNCLWEFSNGQTSTSCSSIIATFTEPGCYDATYTGTTADGCPMSGSFSAIACVYPDPVANFSYNPTDPTILTTDIHFINHSVDAVSYQWTFSGYGSSTEQNPLHHFNGLQPNDVINACLEVTSIGGCVDTTCHKITFTDEFMIYVPNAFTPDGDAYNNTFLPVLPAGTIIDQYNLTIFDRWGEIIFESLDYQVGWDGKYHDNLVQDGVYTWTIQLHEGFKHTTKKFVGHVSVLR